MHPDEAFSTRKRTPKSTGAFLSFGRFYAADTWRGELVMDMGVPWGVFGCPVPVPAEFPSRNGGCGIPVKFPRAKLIFKYIYLMTI